MNRKKPLAEQVILVTGASSGLGRAVARAAGERGAKVVVTARGREGLDACVREIEAVRLGGARRARRLHGAGRGRAGRRAGDRPLRTDRHVCRERDRHGLRGDLPLRGRRAPPDHGRQLLRPGLRLLGGAAAPARDAAGRSSPCSRRSPTGASRCRAGTARRRRRCGTSSSRARVELEKANFGVDVSVVHPAAINTPQFDRDRQKIGKQPQPVPPIYQPEPFARGRAPLLRAADPRAARRLGRAEAHVGPEALAARRRPRCCCARAGSGQHTGEDKPIGSPDNLLETLPGDPGAHGRFDDRRAARRSGRRCGSGARSSEARSRRCAAQDPLRSWPRGIGARRPSARLRRVYVRRQKPRIFQERTPLRGTAEAREPPCRAGGRHRDREGRRPRGRRERGARDHGPERLREEHPLERDHGPPGLRDHGGPDPRGRRGRDGAGRERARRARPLPRVPVPARDSGRDGAELPPQRDQLDPQGAERRRRRPGAGEAVHRRDPRGDGRTSRSRPSSRSGT